MSEKSAGAILSATIEKIRDLVDTSTIIGEPIYAEGGITIIPVSKVTYGFASGGTDFPSKSNAELFGGGGELFFREERLPECMRSRSEDEAALLFSLRQSR